MGETGDTAPKIRGRIQGGRNVLQGGGTSDITVWFGDVCLFVSNGEEGRRVTHRLTYTDNVGMGPADRIKDVGYARGGSSAGSGVNAVRDDLYMDTAGNRGTVGGVTTYIRNVCRG